MRLIDADKFGVISLQGKSEDFIEGAKFILEKIDEAPTLPNPCGKPCAFERPYGEWIETSNIWETEDLSGWGYWKECSSCHCQEKRRTSFCPNCGADMRPREGDRNE